MEPRLSPQASNGTGDQRVAAPRILVLDTSSRNLRVIERCLRALGYQVTSVAEAERLKLELRAAPAEAIVASADVSQGAGLDIVRDLYAQAPRPLPVIAVSALKLPEEVLASAPVELLMGAALHAPLDPAELARAVTKVVAPPDRAKAAEILDDLVKDLGNVGARLDPPHGDMRIEKTSIAVMLWSVDFNDWTGVLHIRDFPAGGLKLWCEFGQLVFAQTGDGGDVLRTAVEQERIAAHALPKVPLRNMEDETGLLMALRAIGMHEVDAIVNDTVLRLLRAALVLPAGRVVATEDETAVEELENPLSIPPLMAAALASQEPRSLMLHRTSSVVGRLPPSQVVDGWGFSGHEAKVLSALRKAAGEETSLDAFLKTCAGTDIELMTRTGAMLDLLLDSGFVDIQGRAFDAETERVLSELVGLIHRAQRGNKFEALGLTPDAREKQIREAGRELAKKYHPDNYFDAAPRVQETAAALFTLFQEAYTTLKTKETREEYRGSLTGASQEMAPVKGDPALSKVEVHKGKRLLDKKRYVEAVKRFRDATLHDPTNPGAQIMYGWARYLETRDASIGTQEIEKALRLDERSADAWYYLGRIAFLQKDTVRAAKRYRKALSFQESHMEAQRELRLLERREEEAGKSARESGGWGRGLLRRLAGKDEG